MLNFTNLLILISFLLVKSSFILDSQNYSIEEILKIEIIPKKDLIEIYDKYSNKLNEFNNYFVQIIKLDKEINSNEYGYLNDINTNATIVYLLESCYNRMKANYSSDIYYLFIIDEFPNENYTIYYMNKFKYIIFNSEGIKIDITKLFCEKNTFFSLIFINYNKTTIDLDKILYWKKEKNIDLLNIKDEFFWDVCIEYKDEDGLEMPMNIRKQKFYQNYEFCNNTVENNVYSGFEYDSKSDTLIVKCSYRIFTEKELSKHLFQLDEDLKEMVQYSNFKVLSCYKLIFKFYGKYFISNLGNIICFILTLGYITLIILFAIYTTKEFEIKLNHFYKDAGFDIDAMNINYNNTNKADIIYLDLDKLKNENNKKNNKEFQKKYLFRKIKIYEIKNKPKNGKDKSHNHHKKDLEKYETFQMTKSDDKEINSVNKLNYLNEKNEEFKDKYKNKDSNKVNSIKDKDNSLKYLCGIIEDDLNELELEEAIAFDYRSFWKINFCYFKQYQLFYFTFIRKDFNIQIAKYVLFIFQITLIFLFNTMFYTDSTMENYYKNKYILDLIGTIRRSIISSICTSVILVILKCLCFSEKGSREIRFYKGIKQSFIKYKIFIKRLKIRIIIYLILVFILHLGCYYFIKGFCAVYPRTQFYLLLDTLISIILNNIYPLGICLLPTLLRYLSLKRKNKVIYILSQLF